MPVASKGIVITKVTAVIRQECEMSRTDVLALKRD